MASIFKHYEEGHKEGGYITVVIPTVWMGSNPNAKKTSRFVGVAGFEPAAS